MKLLLSLLSVFGFFFLSGCSLFPSHIQTEDHAHSTGELVDPNHHNGEEQGHGNGHGSHADMITDELSFISEMIPHHWEAVQASNDMADETDELKDPVFFALLTGIMETQRAEIAMMQSWYTEYLYPSCKEQKQTFDECQSISSYKPSYKNMMRDFSSETGANRKVMYLTDMIVHHQGAIDMANKLLEIMNTQDPLIKLTEAGMNHRNEVKAFAQAIISTQSKEIEEMQRMISN